MKNTIEIPANYREHELLMISAHMGEIREILRGFETGEISGKENRKFARTGIQYLDAARQKLDEIRAELKSRNPN